MPRTALSAQKTTRAGLNAAYTAATVDGFFFPPAAVLHVKNGGAGATVITVPTPATFDGQPVDDLTVTIPAAGERFIGPFTARAFGQADGTAWVNASVLTSVTMAAVVIS